MAVTSPESSTETTDASLETQLGTTPSTGWPLASSTRAVRRIVSSSARNHPCSGDSAISLACCSTVTSALPETLVPVTVAVVVASPFLIAVTSPVASTVATDSSLLLHDTFAPGIGWPLWSRTVVFSCTVCPSAASVALEGTTVTEAGVGGVGVMTSAGPPSPQARSPASGAANTRPIHRMTGGPIRDQLRSRRTIVTDIDWSPNPCGGRELNSAPSTAGRC